MLKYHVCPDVKFRSLDMKTDTETVLVAVVMTEKSAELLVAAERSSATPTITVWEACRSAALTALESTAPATELSVISPSALIT